MSSTGVRKKRTPFDIAIESLRDTNSADIERMKMFSAESSPISGQVGGASTNSATPGGSFLNIAGQTPMLGAIAFNPVDVVIDSNGRIDITPDAVSPSNYSTYVLMTGAGTPDDLNFIDGAANNGQLLYLQGVATQVLTIKHAEIGTISTIVGTTTVTVTTLAAHNLTTGDKVDISGTTNFNIQNASVTVTGGTTFTYSATGSATSETTGTFQNGNVVTSDGTDIILDGTTATNAVPWIALLFDPTVTAFGAWRVQFGAGAAGGGLTEPIILGINTLTPQTSPTVTPIAWNTKNPQHIIIDRNITFSFTNLPTSGKYEGILVIIDIDSTGGFNTPIWPASVTNPPTVSTIANTRTSVMLYTIDAGTTVTHATSVGSASSGGTTTLSGLTIDVNKNWDAKGISNFGALTGVTSIDLDGATALIQGVKELRFFDDDPNKNIQSAVDELSFNVPALDQFSFYANAVEMARIIETAAGVYRLDMLDHAIDNSRDIRFSDSSGATIFAGTDPAIGFNSTTSRLILNMPAAANLFVTNNNTIGSTQMSNNSITSNIVNASDVLQLGVDVTVPTVEGEMRNNGTDVNVFSGGAVRNLSNIGVAGGANVNLSNLSSPTSVNQNIIPQAGKTLGSSGNEWSSVFTNNLRFGTAGVISATSLQIFGDVNGITFNIPSGSTDNYDFQAGGVSKVTISDSGTVSAPNIILSNTLTINNSATDPSSNGQFTRNVNDVKVFTGGAVKNLSDIGTGTFLPLAGGTMTGAINMGNNDLTAVDDIFFNTANASIETSATLVTHDFPSGQTWRVREGSTSRVIIDTGFRTTTTTNVGFFGVTAVGQQTIPVGATLAQVVTALRNLGLGT